MTCEWGGNCPNAAVVRHVFVWPNDGGRSSEVFCASCARMDRGVAERGPHNYDLLVEPINGVGSEETLSVEVMCIGIASLGAQS